MIDRDSEKVKLLKQVIEDQKFAFNTLKEAYEEKDNTIYLNTEPQPFAFGRLKPTEYAEPDIDLMKKRRVLAFGDDTKKDNYIEELFARNKRQEKTIKDLNKVIASQDSKLSTELWEVKGALAGSKQTNKWLSENNENLKSENRRHKSSIFHSNKRHEDLMSYQDKQNEEIEKLNRAVKQLKKIQTDYVETVIRIENLRIAEEFENTKLKERNKALRKKAGQEIERQRTEIEDLRELLDGERTCFGCKADITATGGLPIVCQKCDCKDNWEAK